MCRISSNLVYGWESRHWRRLLRGTRPIVSVGPFDKSRDGSFGSRRAVRCPRDADGGPARGAGRGGSSSTVLWRRHEGARWPRCTRPRIPNETRALILFHPIAYELRAERAVSGRSQDRRATRTMRHPGAQRQGARRHCAVARFRPGGAGMVRRTRFGRGQSGRRYAPSTAPGSRPTFARFCPRFGAYARHVPDARRRAQRLARHRQGGAAARDVTDFIVCTRCSRLGTELSAIFLSPEIPEEVIRFAAGEAGPMSPTASGRPFSSPTSSARPGSESAEFGGPCLARTARASPLPRAPTAEPLPSRGARHRRRRLLQPSTAPAARDSLCPSTRGWHAYLGLEVRAGVHTGECELHDGKSPALAVSMAPDAPPPPAQLRFSSRRRVNDGRRHGALLEDRGERELKESPAMARLPSLPFRTRGRASH